MHEQVEKSKDNKSRAVANSVAQKKGVGKQGLGFMDNRPESLAQKKLQEMADSHSQTIQLHPCKFVTKSARKHYDDGWGEKYDIEGDGSLKADVPDNVTGSGGIDLGWFDAPEDEQVKGDRRFEKECTIEYADGNRINETKIFHCGPTGPRHYYDEKK